MFPITNLSEWIHHSFCVLRTSIFRYYESSSRLYGKAICTAERLPLGGQAFFPVGAAILTRTDEMSPPYSKSFSPCPQVFTPRHSEIWPIARGGSPEYPTFGNGLHALPSGNDVLMMTRLLLVPMVRYAFVRSMLTGADGTPAREHRGFGGSR